MYLLLYLNSCKNIGEIFYPNSNFGPIWSTSFFYFYCRENIFVLTHCTTRVIIEIDKERKIEALSSLPLSSVFQIVQGVGMAIGRGQRMGPSSPPCMILSCPIPAPPCMTENTFSPHPCPLGPREATPCPVKLYFLLICPTTSTIFFYETYFINKNILEITNLSHQIKSIFRKNWIIYPSV